MSPAFDLERTDAVLVFRTRSYKAEQGSALHSGIFNREMVSTLAAGAVLVAVAMIATVMGAKPGLIYAGPATALFAAVFFVFRFFVLSELQLEVTIDKGAGMVTIETGAILRKRTRSIALSGLVAITNRSFVVDPVNKDGIKVVEHIAIQHGMHIPGYGERKEFYMVGIRGADEVTIFASTDADEAQRLTDALTNFTGVGVAQEN